MPRPIRKLGEKNWWEKDTNGRTIQVFLVATLVATATGVVLVLRRRRKHLNDVVGEDVREVPVPDKGVFSFMRRVRVIIHALAGSPTAPDVGEVADKLGGGGEPPT